MAKSAIWAIDRHISYEIRVAVDRWGFGYVAGYRQSESHHVVSRGIDDVRM